MDMIGFGYRRYPSYNGYNGGGEKGIDKMIDPLIAKHDGLPALPTQRRLLFFHCGIGGELESAVDRKYSRITNCVPRGQASSPFTMEAVVILPDQLHCILTLSEGDDDFSTRWRQIKMAFSRLLPETERRSKSRLNKGERVSGSGDFGSMRYGMTRITGITWIRFITTR